MSGGESHIGSTAAVVKRTSAARTRLYRERKAKKVRCVRVRISQLALGALAVGGFLSGVPLNELEDFEIEAGIYKLINKAITTGLIQMV
jgi:hypothetical protein